MDEKTADKNGSRGRTKDALELRINQGKKKEGQENGKKKKQHGGRKKRDKKPVKHRVAVMETPGNIGINCQNVCAWNMKHPQEEVRRRMAHH